MKGVYHRGVTGSEILKENKIKTPTVMQVLLSPLSSHSLRKVRR